MANNKQIFRALLESVLDSANDLTEEECLIKNLRQELIDDGKRNVKEIAIKIEEEEFNEIHEEKYDNQGETDVSTEEKFSPKYFSLSKILNSPPQRKLQWTTQRATSFLFQKLIYSR